MHEHRPVLVLGGTGKTGRRVAARLSARGTPVRLGSRGASPAFDWHDPSGWPAVLAGVGAVYIAYQPDLAAPGAHHAIAGLARAGARAGVERFVLLSGRGEPGVLPSEQAVLDTGVPTTILRAAWFAQNFSEGFLADGIARGELAFPGGDVAEPFVDVDDIADVAVAALCEPGHAGRIYELTGPRLVSFADAVAEIGAALGRSIAYVPVSSAAYAEILRPFMPAEEIEFLVGLFAEVLDGHNSHVADGVGRALGRAPRDFRSYAQAAAAAGAWPR